MDWWLVVLTVVAAFGLALYAKLAIDLLARGQSRVRCDWVGFPDILLGTVLLMYWGSAIARGFTAQTSEPAESVKTVQVEAESARPVATPEQSKAHVNGVETEHPQKITWAGVLQIVLISSMVVGSILLSLRTRNLKFTEITNLWRIPFHRALAAAVLLLVTAGAMVLLLYLIEVNYIGVSNNEQNSIKVLRAASSWDRWALIFSAAIVAPISEEIIFRGYLYPLIKRFFGASIGILLIAALFAASHLHGPTLAPLFIFGVCLALAYETTGSLLVPILMHFLFNSTMLAVIVKTTS